MCKTSRKGIKQTQCGQFGIWLVRCGAAHGHRPPPRLNYLEGKCGNNITWLSRGTAFITLGPESQSTCIGIYAGNTCMLLLVICCFWVKCKATWPIQTFHPFGVCKWVVIHVITWITEVETINGRPGLRMAVCRGPKSVGAGLAYSL